MDHTKHNSPLNDWWCNSIVKGYVFETSKNQHQSSSSIMPRPPPLFENSAAVSPHHSHQWSSSLRFQKRHKPVIAIAMAPSSPLLPLFPPHIISKSKSSKYFLGKKKKTTLCLILSISSGWKYFLRYLIKNILI